MLVDAFLLRPGIKLCPEPVAAEEGGPTDFTATTLHLGLEKSKVALEASIRLDDFSALEAVEQAAKEAAEAAAAPVRWVCCSCGDEHTVLCSKLCIIFLASGFLLPYCSAVHALMSVCD